MQPILYNWNLQLSTGFFSNSSKNESFSEYNTPFTLLGNRQNTPVLQQPLNLHMRTCDTVARRPIP